MSDPPSLSPGFPPPRPPRRDRARNAEVEALVVEDDPLSAKLLVGLLRTEGYRVRHAADGPAAIRAAHETIPDIVFLDVMMPGMTGYEVCQALKSHPRTRLTQVMMVTALSGTPNQVTGLDTGADDYCTKPVRREELLAKTRALLRARRLLLELEDARCGLAARNEELQLKKSLAQSLVHDLKNPLSAIIANLELLSMQPAKAAAASVDRCRLSASRMLRMILDLLDVERLEEGKLTLKLERVDLSDLATSAVAEAATATQKVDFVLVRSKSEATAPTVCDAGLLRRVFDNLLANAAAHSPVGDSVTVELAATPEGTALSVADKGPGVPLEHRESVFEKYAQFDLHRQGITTNRGLGLTFCRLAVEAHGGSIWVDDDPDGGGAVFRVQLPAAEVEAVGRPLRYVENEVGLLEDC